MLKKISLLLITSILFVSCGDDGKNAQDASKNDSNINIQIENEDINSQSGTDKKSQEQPIKPEIKPIKIESIGIKNSEPKEKVEYNKKEEKLYIGDKVEITKGLSSNFPKEIEIYKNNQTYTNSNVRDYTFFIDNNAKNVEEISKFYIDLFKKLGYTQVVEEIKVPEGDIIQDETTQEKTIDNLKFVLKNPDYKEQKEGELPGDIKEFKQKIMINIYNSTPANIEKGMGLKGNFVEIYYNQM